MGESETSSGRKRVLIISSQPPEHSAGLGADLVDALRRDGVEVDFLTRATGEAVGPGVITVGEAKRHVTTLKHGFRGIVKRILGRRLRGMIRKIIAGRREAGSGGDIRIKYPDEMCPAVPVEEVTAAINKDYELIITLFWEDMITSETLRGVYEKTKAPIIIFSPDMAPMTGGCFYFGDCRRFREGCGKCPAYGGRTLDDPTRRNFAVKKSNYALTGAKFFGNTWMCSYARESGIFPPGHVCHGEIIINEDTLRIKPREECRRQLGLPEELFLIMLRSSWDVRKGNDDMLQGIVGFMGKLMPEERERVRVITVGDDTFADKGEKYGIKTTDLGRVGADRLIEAYNAADMFLCASRDDAGPSMINQSLMCGTPVVSYRLGAALDVVEDGVSGYSSEPGDTEGLARGMEKIYREGMSREGVRGVAMAHNSREAVMASIARIVSPTCPGSGSDD